MAKKSPKSKVDPANAMAMFEAEAGKSPLPRAIYFFCARRRLKRTIILQFLRLLEASGRIMLTLRSGV